MEAGRPSRRHLIPTGDGLGLELNRKSMAKYPFASQPVRMFQYAVYDIRPPDEKSYGIDYHLGAYVIYCNKECRGADHDPLLPNAQQFINGLGQLGTGGR